MDALEAKILRDPDQPGDPTPSTDHAPGGDPEVAFDQDIDLKDLPGAGGAGTGTPEPPA